MLLGREVIDRALFRDSRFAVDDPHLADWDQLTVAGFGDFFSERVTNILAPHSANYIDFVETAVNSYPYFCPRRLGGLDCLDESRSRPWAEKFFINKQNVTDPMVFLISEKPGGWPNRPDPTPIFLTQSVEALVARCGARGIHLVETDKIRFRMSESEIANLEASLGFRLPDAYKSFVSNYPPELVTTEIDMSWKKEAPADREMRIDPVDILALNRNVRSPGTPWTEGEGPWPEQFFVIGDDECGNYWAIDLCLSDPCPVYFYDHDFGKFSEEHHSLGAFAEHLVVHHNEWNAKKRRT
jgi:hypothetical protein